MFPARILPPGTGGKKFLLLVAGTASGSAGSGLFSRFLGSAAGSRSFSGLFGCAASCGSLSRLLGSAACSGSLGGLVRSAASSGCFSRLVSRTAGRGSLGGLISRTASGGGSLLFLFFLTPSEQIGKCHCDILLRFRQSLFCLCNSNYTDDFRLHKYALFCKYIRTFL